MKTLFKSIYSHFTSDPLANSLLDLYNTQAPQDAAFPYGVFSLISDVLDFTFTENFENVLLQFNLFSNKRSSLQICELYELLKGDPELGTGFDFLDLSLDNYTAISMVRENAILTILEDRVWQYNVTYRMVLEDTGVTAHAVVNKFLYNLLSI